jgi:hypothetical protein
MAQGPRAASVVAMFLAALQRVPALGERVHSGYLFGSAADGSAVATSDIDLCLVVHGAATDAEIELLRSIALAISRSHTAVLDVVVFGSDALQRDGHYRIREASQHMWGEDLRPAMPVWSVERYVRHYRNAPFSYSVQVLRGLDHLILPLDYPDPTGEFFGYDATLLPPGGAALHNVKALVSAACWHASLLVTLRTGTLPRSKGDAVRLYREQMDDQWAALIEQLYGVAGQTWHYSVPDTLAERGLLRGWCKRMLAFENHSFSVLEQ